MDLSTYTHLSKLMRDRRVPLKIRIEAAIQASAYEDHLNEQICVSDKVRYLHIARMILMHRNYTRIAEGARSWLNRESQ